MEIENEAVMTMTFTGTFAYYSLYGLGAWRPETTRICSDAPRLDGLHYEKGWHCVFFMDDRRRAALSRGAFIWTDEDLIEFIRRGGGIQGSEDKFHL